jgi:hypothetical protein
LRLEVTTSADEDSLLSWRHGDRHSEVAEDPQQPWSPTRLLQKSFWSTFFRGGPPMLPAH